MRLATALALFGLAYVLAAGLGQGLAVIPGIAVTFWPPAGLFVGALLLAPRRRWLLIVAVACLAELLASALWFGNATGLAVLYFGANAAEAVVVALVLLRCGSAPYRLDRLRDVSVLALAALTGPVLGASLIAGIDAAIGKHTFASAWPLVWLGDASGLLISTPLVLAMAHAWRERRRLRPVRLAEAAAVALLLAAVASAALAGKLPTVWMVLPVLLWAAMRFRLEGAATAMALLVLVVAVFTATGAGGWVGAPDEVRARVVGLQIFFAIASVSALFVGALARQLGGAVATLQSANALLEQRVAERTATLAAREAQLRLFIDNAPASIAMFDRDMRYVAASRRWMRAHAREALDLVGRLHPEGLPPLPASWCEAHARALQGLAQHRDAERLAAPDGAERWIRWEVHPWRDAEGQVGGSLVAAEDITEARAAEHALREADRRKDEFLAMLAHELRNPLAPIRSAAQLLHGGAQGPLQVQALSTVVGRHVAHLSRLVDDLMDVARMKQGKIVLQEGLVDIGQVARDAAEMSRAAIEGPGHALVLDLPPPGSLVLRGDGARLTQVLCNLLNNAAKFTPPGGRIRLVATQDGGDAVVRVHDSGRGIAPAQLPRVFDLFMQCEPGAERAQGGLGVGLALAQSIVRLHGGSIGAASDVGIGSTFTVRLPGVVEAARPAPLPLAAGGQPAPMRVLVVDDNEDAADTLAMLMRFDGHEVLVAHTPQRALAEAARFAPQLCVLDIGLPGMDGQELARRLRLLPALHGARFVALTGYSSGRANGRGHFDHVLTKPAEPAQVYAAIARGPATPMAA